MGGAQFYRLMFDDGAAGGDQESAFRSVEALLDTPGSAAAGVLFTGMSKSREDRERVLQAVWRVRNQAAFFLKPIYFESSMEELDVFADGAAWDEARMAEHARAIARQCANIRLEEVFNNKELAFLTFLFSRGGGALEVRPLARPSLSAIYIYPAAAPWFDDPAFMGGAAQADGNFSVTRLASLASRGFLAKKELLDRIRVCPGCFSGHLNYIDVCALCESIDFEKKRMLHCFTCAFVAPEEQFKQGMGLQCPRCGAVLRHIGSDYDRPMESYLCNRCHERFMEPTVYAQCLQCHKKTKPEDLAVRRIYAYALAEKGMQAVRNGRMDSSIGLFDEYQNVLFPYFCYIADWLFKMRRRYADEDFSLLYISLQGTEQTRLKLGSEKFESLVAEISSRVRALIRDTDIATSRGESAFWLLLPRTPQKGGEVLAARIRKLGELVHIHGVDFSIYTQCVHISAEEYAKRENATAAFIHAYETQR